MRTTPFGRLRRAWPVVLVGLLAFSWGCDAGSGSAPSAVPSLEVVMTTTGGLIAQETTQEVWSDGRVVVRSSLGGSREKYFSAGELSPVRAVVHSGDFRALASSYGPDLTPGCDASAHRLSVRQGGSDQVVRGFSGYNPAVLDEAISELTALAVQIP
jgi:hypothetical protein